MKVKAPLKAGESFTGKVVEVFETMVLLETKDGKSVKLPLPAEVLDVIDAEHNGMFGGDVIKITRDGDEYDIEELENGFDGKEEKA